jgi:Tat protein translocase TatB subunit
VLVANRTREMPAPMFNLGPMELLVIVVVALVVLGPQRLPDAMRQVGKAVAEARRWSSSLTSTVQSAFDDEPGRPSTGTADVASATAPAASPAPSEATA